MIVRNEGHCIERCLSSVKPFIESWSIIDTGSTDDTMEKVRRTLKGIPGTLHERPWVDFGHNRTEMLHMARDWDGYLFTIDADETFCGCFPPLSAPCYALTVHHAGASATRPCLFRAGMDWGYVGKIHEYPVPLEFTANPPVLATALVSSHADGGRHLVPGWEREDILLATEQFSASQDPRDLFHLARMEEAYGSLPAAMEHYRVRSMLGGWDQEVWYSLWRVAEIMRRLSGPEFDQAVVAAYVKAIDNRQTRTEAAYALADYMEAHGRNGFADLIRSVTKTITSTTDTLLVDPNCYGAADAR